MRQDTSQYDPIYFSSRDGLRLHARHYRAAAPQGRPAICLPGLTRNSRDFHDLALAISKDSAAPRDVFALDYRGRGLSGHDPRWQNYSPLSEALDVVDLMTIHGLHDAAFVGTSRGGLIAMVLAAAQPGAVGAVVFNDIGPVIERDGLARIAGYVGRAPLPASWPEAATMVREMNRRHFPDVSEPLWDEIARAWFNERNGRPAAGYDAKIANTLSILDGPVPALWPQFESIRKIPAMVIRGENSDILSMATVEEMRRRHPSLAVVSVPRQGHAPLLKDAPTISAIVRFLAASDQRAGVKQPAYH